MILVISRAADEHARAVLAGLDALGARARLLDLSSYPVRSALTIRYAPPERPRHQLAPFGEEPVDLDDVGVIWWRRPQPPALDPAIEDSEYRRFAISECHEAITGLWLAQECFWVNHPTRDEVAHRKAYQLAVAQQVGLRIPETLITSDPDAARAFIDRRGPARTIYKAFSATPQSWRETRLLREEELLLLEQVRYAPVIFQEYVEARVDLRVTIVGDDLFAAAIHSQESSYPVDFRMDLAATQIEAFELPDCVEARLRDLMTQLGLVYGAVDMRLTPDDQVVFLEINPAGQWLFVEQRSGQPISARMAALLAAHDR